MISCLIAVEWLLEAGEHRLHVGWQGDAGKGGLISGRCQSIVEHAGVLEVGAPAATVIEGGCLHDGIQGDGGGVALASIDFDGELGGVINQGHGAIGHIHRGVFGPAVADHHALAVPGGSSSAIQGVYLGGRRRFRGGILLF